MFARQHNIDVIVGHGLKTEDPRFDRELLQEEMCPIFMAPARANAGLTTNDLFRILQGEVVDWQEVGQVPGRINLYLHGGVLQKPALESLFRQNGVDLEKVKAANPKYAKDYADLEWMASKDTNALVIGLRTLTPDGLAPAKLNGVSVVEKTAPRTYPLREEIFVYKRKSSANSAKVAEDWKQKVDSNIPSAVKAVMKRQAE